MLYPISQFVEDCADMIVGFINAEGEIKVAPRFAGAGHFREGRASVVEHNGHSGFLDLSGKIVIPASFQGVGHFHESVCSIGADSRAGYIDYAGRWLIEPRFLIAMAFSGGRSFVSDDGETFHLIDTAGSPLGADGYQRARPFRAGLAPVMKEGKWGFINNRGSTVIPFIFDDVLPQHFKFGLAAAKLEGRWGFIDHSGFFAINPVYEEVRPFAEGLAPVRVEHRWGLIDLGGRLRLPPTWDEVGQFVNGLAPARLNGQAGYINSSGGGPSPPNFRRPGRSLGSLQSSRWMMRPFIFARTERSFGGSRSTLLSRDLRSLSETHTFAALPPSEENRHQVSRWKDPLCNVIVSGCPCDAQAIDLTQRSGFLDRCRPIGSNPDKRELCRGRAPFTDVV